ncbi:MULTISPECIES: hypothetical protein [unclassified Streptomyces]|nr:hypothetical protein OG452_04245 [Streptomyces sp. NBC_01197]WSS52643.1 hypothetical protein OG708_30830 [Streptomyces sp. NBC_01180]
MPEGDRRGGPAGADYFGPDKAFKSNLDRSARRAARRMIRREEDVDE